jgi:hypothetical protein
MAIEIVDLPTKNGDFPSFLYAYQRVYCITWPRTLYRHAPFESQLSNKDPVCHGVSTHAFFGIETSPDCQIADHCVLFLQDVRTPEHVYKWVSTTAKNNNYMWINSFSIAPKMHEFSEYRPPLLSTPCLSSWTWNPVTRSYWSDRGCLIIHKNHVEWSMFNDFLSPWITNQYDMIILWSQCPNIWWYGSVSKPCTPVVHIKIAGKWMFIPLKMVLIGIDPYPYSHAW